MQAEISEQDQDEIFFHSAETLFDKETELFVPYRPESTGWEICKETMSFALDVPSTLPIKTRNKTKFKSVEAEFLQNHYDLVHLRPLNMQSMANKGELPKRFARCKLPMCSACMYGKATRKAWRRRTKDNTDEAEEPKQLEGLVSVDQLISTTPGFIAQICGILTTNHYTCATVYLNQASKLGFLWIQKTTAAKYTVEGKKEFEKYARYRGVQIQHYHADKGIFKSKLWVLDCQLSRQRITYAGVGAHHQNGVSKRKIRVLQDLNCTQLIHANQRWPAAINAHMWPYALRLTCAAWNESLNMKDSAQLSPEQAFTKVKANHTFENSVPFGCPVYVLEQPMQDGGHQHK